MTTKHTPGPWYVGAQNDAIYIIAGRPPALNNDFPVHGADRELIAAMKGDGYSMDSANASLIAAAPDLLAALQVVMPALEVMRKQWPRSKHDDSLDVVAFARAAIAKATGA